jgi:hypothetical protein
VRAYCAQIIFGLLLVPRFSGLLLDSLVELSGIEPLTSSLRIQRTTIDGEIPDDTE